MNNDEIEAVRSAATPIVGAIIDSFMVSLAYGVAVQNPGITG